MLRVEKVGAHAAFWENLWAKAGPNRASIDSPEKRIMLDFTNGQFYWSRSYVRLSLKIPSQYEKYTRGFTWRLLA